MANDEPTDRTLRERFDALVIRWKRERDPHSSSGQLTRHPAYQEIIGLGPPVVPLLLQELERAPDHWFRALHALTGANPVPETDRGKVREMAAAWLRWARDNGYRW
jgi:hypothetical protein